jgi:hypothetical protein
VTGLVQVAFVLTAAAAVAATLRHRRFRRLAGLVAGAVTAGAVLAGILYLAGDKHPHTVTAAAGHSSWLASAAFPGPALLAAAVAVTVAAAPWLSRPWRRTATPGSPRSARSTSVPPSSPPPHPPPAASEPSRPPWSQA